MKLSVIGIVFYNIQYKVYWIECWNWFCWGNIYMKTEPYIMQDSNCFIIFIPKYIKLVLLYLYLLFVVIKESFEKSYFL